MRKKLSLVIMFLLTFFSFAFLGTTKVQATTETVSYDLNSINVPTTVIASFPVTHKSVHGNTITWTVEKDQEVISYDAEAHWMVVNRPSEGDDKTVKITVTVTDGTNTETKDFNVNVPVGKTATPVYTIKYNLDGGELTTPKTEYRLGEATFTLPTPTKEGFTFDGWYENDTKIEKVLVGNSRNLTLTAHWTKDDVNLSEVNISLEQNEYTYAANEIEIEVSVIDGETTLVKDTHYTVTYKLGETAVDNVKEAGTYVVVITGKENSGYTGSKELTLKVNKAALTLTPNAKSIHAGSAMPNWTSDDFTVDGILGADTVNVDYSETLQTVKDADGGIVVNTLTAGRYTVEFSGITIDNPNYDLTVNKAELSIIQTNIKVELSFTTIAYDGNTHKPTVTVKDGETLLVENTHYTLLYPTDVVNAGNKVITISGIGSYEGTDFGTVNYEITKKTVQLTAKDATYVYGDTPQANGYEVSKGILSQEELEALEITVTCQDGATKVSYKTNGNYDIECVDGTVNMTKRPITLTADSLESVYGTAVKELTFTVSGYTLSTKDLAELKGLISLTKQDGTDVDTYTITIKYTTDEVSDKFEVTFVNGVYTITQLDLSELATIELDGNDYSIQNGNVQPTITVKYNGETIPNSSYDVDYINTDKAGTATVKVIFSGNYSGNVSKDYTITANGQAKLDKDALVEDLKDTLTGTVKELDNLPLTKGDSTITWVSDSTAVSVNSLTGQVTLVRGNEDLVVTLTATVNCGMTSYSVAEFTFTIAKAETVEKFTVTYVSNGGTEVNSEEVESGQKATKPTDPTRSGYVFKGWFTDDSDFTDAWDFDSDTIASNTTLYAKWEEESKPTLVTKTYTYTFDKKTFDSVGNQTLSGVSWTLAGDGTYFGYDSQNGKGQQFGSNNSPFKNLTLSSNSFTNVTKIIINTSGANGIKAVCKVTVGNVEGSGSGFDLTKTSADYTITFAEAVSGPVQFTYTQTTSSKAIYIKSITVEYSVSE